MSCALTGLGYETAIEFAKRGGRVILACRNKEKGEEACKRIKEVTSNPNVIFKHLDLESLQSVRDFANDIIDTEDRLDILVNNAGSATLPNKLTDDGLQILMQVNYFSHFLLTNLLLDLLQKSVPSRVINLSSAAAKYSPAIDLEDLNRFHGTYLMYSVTKLCNILFTIELAKRLEGSGVLTFSVHPGAVATDAQRFSKIATFISQKFFKSAEDGAQTTLHCCLEDGLEQYNGRHFEDCHPIQTYSKARDPDLPVKLWEATEKILKLKADESNQTS